MTESNAAFSKRVRPHVSQYETTLIEALERLADAEAKNVRMMSALVRIAGDSDVPVGLQNLAMEMARERK